MKVFISWSGERSKRVAELFKTWLKCVLQASDPWVSTQDIDSGSWWFTEIGNQLAETSVGIICLTKENKDKPWILFEAGALTKGLSTSRVIPFLVDLTPTDLQPPLSQLNATLPDKVGLFKLVGALNRQLKEKGLPEEVFTRVFETYWGQFEADFRDALASTPETEKSETRKDKDILSEILLTVRGFDQRIRQLETQSSSQSMVNMKSTRDVIVPVSYDLHRLNVEHYIKDYQAINGKPPTEDQVIDSMASNIPLTNQDLKFLKTLVRTKFNGQITSSEFA